MPPESPSRPQARDDVVFRRLDDEWVVYDPRTNRLHALNLSAALIWEHLTGQLTEEEIAAELARAYGTDEHERVRGDVRAAVQRLAAEGLLR